MRDRHGIPAPEFRMAIVADVAVALPSQHPTVVLRETEAPRRQLSFSVGLQDGVGLSHALRRVPTPRPLTHELITDVLGGFDIDVVAIRLVGRQGQTYFAELDLRGRTGRNVYSCRPTDALAIALHQAVPVPILIDARLLEETGDVVPWTPPDPVAEVGPPEPAGEVGPPVPADEVGPPEPGDEVGPEPAGEVAPPVPADEVGPPEPAGEVGLEAPNSETTPEAPTAEVAPEAPTSEAGPEAPTSEAVEPADPGPARTVSGEAPPPDGRVAGAGAEVEAARGGSVPGASTDEPDPGEPDPEPSGREADPEVPAPVGAQGTGTTVRR